MIGSRLRPQRLLPHTSVEPGDKPIRLSTDGRLLARTPGPPQAGQEFNVHAHNEIKHDPDPMSISDSAIFHLRPFPKSEDKEKIHLFTPYSAMRK